MENDSLEIVHHGRDFTVKVPFKDGRVYFQFSEISRAHQSFSASIVVIVESKTDGVLDEYRQRLDIQSHSAVEGFRRSLQNAFDAQIKWALVINQAFNAIIAKFNEAQEPINFSGKECEPSTFLLSPFLQKDANNMVFGDGEVGKSYFTIRLAASLASGHPFMGFPVEEGGKKTLYLDYEDSSAVFNKRLFEVSTGMGVDKSVLDTHIWWYKPDGSMRDLGEVIARMVEKYSFDLIIIDAGSNAAGGSPNDEQKVIDMFNALEQIPCTKLIIHHEPKQTMGVPDDKAYYGTTFWRALVRVAWRLVLQNEEDGKLIKAVMTKCSNIARVDPFYYRQTWGMGEFGAHYGPVTLERHEPTIKTARDKILEVLAQHGELTRTQILDMTGISLNYFKEMSQKMREDGLIDIRGKGRGSVWYDPSIKNHPPINNDAPPYDENTF